jgi:hypothetical protein
MNLTYVVLLHWKTLTSKALAAYAVLETMSPDGRQCDADQGDIAELAGMSDRHLRRAIKELEAIGLVEVAPLHDRKGYKARNRYILHPPDNMESFRLGIAVSLPDNMESSRRGVNQSLPDNMESSRLDSLPDNMESSRRGVNQSLPDNMESSRRPENGPKTGLPDNMESELHACLNHVTDMHNSEKQQTPVNPKNQVLELLDFLGEPFRSQRARQRHCTLDYAAAWRAWWDRRDFPEWMREPARWASKQMKDKTWPPAQISLPGDSFAPEESPEGLEPPVEGARRLSSGFWT